MKKLMKTAAVVMSAVMMLSMAACAKKADPKEVFDVAVKKNAEMTDMDMDSTMTMKMTQGEQSMDISMKMNAKMNNINTEKMQYLATTTSTAAGQSMEANIFYTDGYYYIDTQGQKIKYAMDLNELMESVKQSTESTNLASDEMKEITMKEDGDNKILTFTADPEKMDTYVQDMMSAMSGQAAGLEGLEMTFKEASGEYTVNKDGYYTAMKMKIIIEMTMDGETVTMDMDIDSTINNPGQAVEITLPDTADYTEIDMSAMTGAPAEAPAEGEAEAAAEGEAETEAAQ